MGITHGLGRLPFEADERDGSYTAERLEAMLELGLAAPVEWGNANRVLDQGRYGTCVAAGTLGLLNTDDAQHNDPRFTSGDIMPFFKTIEGGDVLAGAQVRNGLKAAKKAGLVEAYARLAEDDIEPWLRAHGPVLVGTVWTEKMSEPMGIVVVVDTTNAASGHCWYIHGANSDYWHGTNSWGSDWADHGYFYVSRTDFHDLYLAGGEAWACVQPVAPERTAAAWWQRLIRLFRGGD
jgi:hypothetical protein